MIHAQKLPLWETNNPFRVNPLKAPPGGQRKHTSVHGESVPKSQNSHQLTSRLVGRAVDRLPDNNLIGAGISLHLIIDFFSPACFGPVLKFV